MEKDILEESKVLKDINWNDMIKKKFFGYSAILLITVRGSLYPLSLIKTRLQIQENVGYNEKNKAYFINYFEIENL